MENRQTMMPIQQQMDAIPSALQGNAYMYSIDNAQFPYQPKYPDRNFSPYNDARYQIQPQSAQMPDPHGFSHKDAAKSPFTSHLDDSSYNSGRWTKEEHEKFLEGLHQFGKSWKDIANLIPSRSLVQIRTHAQKYFQKQDRVSPLPSDSNDKSILDTDKKDDGADSHSVEKSPTLSAISHTSHSVHQKSPVVTSLKSPDAQSKSTMKLSLDNNVHLTKSSATSKPSAPITKSLNIPAYERRAEPSQSPGLRFKSEQDSFNTMNSAYPSTRHQEPYKSYYSATSHTLQQPQENLYDKPTYCSTQPFTVTNMPLTMPPTAYSTCPPGITNKPAYNSMYGREAQSMNQLPIGSQPYSVAPQYMNPINNCPIPGYAYTNTSINTGSLPPNTLPLQNTMISTSPNSTIPPMGSYSSVYPGTAPLQTERVMQMLYLYGENEKKESEEKMRLQRKQYELELQNKEKDKQLMKQKELIKSLTANKKNTDDHGIENIQSNKETNTNDVLTSIEDEFKRNKESMNKELMMNQSASAQSDSKSDILTMSHSIVAPSEEDKDTSINDNNKKDNTTEPKLSQFNSTEEQASKKENEDLKTDETETTSKDISKTEGAEETNEKTETDNVLNSFHIENPYDIDGEDISGIDKEKGVPKTPANVQCARSTFHNAVVQGDLEGLFSQIIRMGKEQDSIDKYINHKDVYGYTPLMTAVCLKDDELAYNIVSTLLKYGADINLTDSEGNTAFHWAARVGHPNILKLIYSYGFPPNLQNSEGNTALHFACRYNRVDCVELLLTDMKVDEKVRNMKNQTALDCVYDEETVLSSSLRDNLKHILYLKFPALKTLIAYHPNCLLHIPRNTGSQGENPWEAPARLPAILEHVQKDLYDWEYEISSDFGPIDNSKLKGIHSDKYIRLLEELDSQVNRDGQSVAFTPRVQKGQGIPENQLKAPDSCDTSFSKGTLLAAKTAAGGTCYAIDKVVQGCNRNAFVCVRPPGHHAGIDGLLSNSSSCGFCIYNNIFIGAIHALKTYPDLIKKVAIFDIDIHHGNGTEQLVQHYNRPDQIMFWSFHIFYSDNAEDYSFYPGTGSDHDMIHNVFNTPLVPIWAPNRYNNKDNEDERGESVYRKYVDTRLIPALRTFNPDLILVSAGFDGGYLDAGNIGALANGCNGMNLKCEDYRYILHRVQEVADICCQGRVVSVLEGGYGNYERIKKTKDSYTINRNSLATNVLGHLKGLLGYMNCKSHNNNHSLTVDTEVSNTEDTSVVSSTRSHSSRGAHSGNGNPSSNGNHYCCCGNNTDCKTMIECICGKACGGWVHLTCAGIDPNQDISDMDNFICKWCRTAGIDNINELPESSSIQSSKNPTTNKRNTDNTDEDDVSISTSQKGVTTRSKSKRSKKRGDDSSDDGDNDKSATYQHSYSAKKSSYGFKPSASLKTDESEDE